MLSVLRAASLLCLALGFLGMLSGGGIPYMIAGNIRLFRISAAVFALGWVLMFAHAIVFTLRNGLAASGITIPGIGVCSIGGLAAWWFLFGPRANAYPAIYGLGALILTLFVASYVLPHVYRLKNKR